MTELDYLEELKDDINDYLNDNLLSYEYTNIDDLYSQLYDDLFINDTVTGNASGSYTFSSWQAEENICHSMDLVVDAYTEFGYDTIPFDDLTNAEAMDVTIRCYLLGEALQDVLEDREDINI